MTSFRTLLSIEVLLQLSYPGVPFKGFYPLSPESFEFQNHLNLYEIMNHENLFS